MSFIPQVLPGSAFRAVMAEGAARCQAFLRDRLERVTNRLEEDLQAEAAM
jgi:hypothetical protein